MLSTTSTRTILDAENIHNLLTVYVPYQLPLFLSYCTNHPIRNPLQLETIGDVNDAKRRETKASSIPGQDCNIDKLISPTPGFITTHRCIPKTQRSLGATIFVDHASDFTYAHIMTANTTATTTVETAKAFERIANFYGIKIQHPTFKIRRNRDRSQSEIFKPFGYPVYVLESSLH